MIAYQTAYLKTYYPNEFIAASMTNDISNTDKLSEFYEELKTNPSHTCTRFCSGPINKNINRLIGSYIYYT